MCQGCSARPNARGKQGYIYIEADTECQLIAQCFEEDTLNPKLNVECHNDWTSFLDVNGLKWKQQQTNKWLNSTDKVWFPSWI